MGFGPPAWNGKAHSSQDWSRNCLCVEKGREWRENRFCQVLSCFSIFTRRGQFWDQSRELFFSCFGPEARNLCLLGRQVPNSKRQTIQRKKTPKRPRYMLKPCSIVLSYSLVFYLWPFFRLFHGRCCTQRTNIFLRRQSVTGIATFRICRVRELIITLLRCSIA